MFKRFVVLTCSAMLLLAACEGTINAASSPLLAPTESGPLLPTRTLTPTITPNATNTPSPTPRPSPTLMPTIAPLTSDGWQTVRSGIYIREMVADPISKTGRVDVVKIDPSQVDFHVRYQPEAPLKVTVVCAALNQPEVLSQLPPTVIVSVLRAVSVPPMRLSAQWI